MSLVKEGGKQSLRKRQDYVGLIIKEKLGRVQKLDKVTPLIADSPLITPSLCRVDKNLCLVRTAHVPGLAHFL